MLINKVLVIVGLLLTANIANAEKSEISKTLVKDALNLAGATVTNIESGYIHSTSRVDPKLIRGSLLSRLASDEHAARRK